MKNKLKALLGALLVAVTVGGLTTSANAYHGFRVYVGYGAPYYGYGYGYSPGYYYGGPRHYYGGRRCFWARGYYDAYGYWVPGRRYCRW